MSPAIAIHRRVAYDRLGATFQTRSLDVAGFGPIFNPPTRDQY